MLHEGEVIQAARLMKIIGRWAIRRATRERQSRYGREARREFESNVVTNPISGR